MTQQENMPPSFLRQVVEIILLCALLALVWELLVDLRHWDSVFVASPKKILRAMWEFKGLLWKDSLFTFVWIVVGFLITAVAAFVGAIALHLLPQQLSRPVHGLLVILQSVPVFAVAPALVYWSGIGNLTRIVIIALVAFFPILVSTADGLRGIDHDLLDLFDSMNATTWQKLVHLEIPSALVMVVAGLKITLTMCAIGAVVAEMTVGEMIGLGYRPKEASAHFRMDEVFACIVLLAVVVMALYWLLTSIARKAQPWREEL